VTGVSFQCSVFERQNGPTKDAKPKTTNCPDPNPRTAAY
jgi:hypothetical protein